MADRPVLTELAGDATYPVDTGGPRVIAHVCNDAGGWGRGFVRAVSARWPEPEAVYREAFRRGRTVPGDVRYVAVDLDLWVANMIAQRGYASPNQPALSYPALRTCLAQLSVFAKRMDATVHMPRIGAGLAGGNWNLIRAMVQEVLVDAGVPVWVYLLRPSTPAVPGPNP